MTDESSNEQFYKWVEKATYQEVFDKFNKLTKKQLADKLAGLAKLTSSTKFDTEHWREQYHEEFPNNNLKIKNNISNQTCNTCGSEVKLPLWAEHFKKGFEELNK